MPGNDQAPAFDDPALAPQRAAALVSSQVSPEQAARAKDMGLPPDIAQHIPEQPAPTHPSLGPYFADPANAAISRGDEQPLSKMASDVNRTVLENRAKQTWIDNQTMPESLRSLGYSAQHMAGTFNHMLLDTWNLPNVAAAALGVPGSAEAAQAVRKSAFARDADASLAAGSKDPEYAARTGQSVGDILTKDPTQAVLATSDFIMQMIPWAVAGAGGGEAGMLGKAAVPLAAGALGTEKAAKSGLGPGASLVAGAETGGVMALTGAPMFAAFTRAVTGKVGPEAAYAMTDAAWKRVASRMVSQIPQHAFAGAALAGGNAVVDYATGQRKDMDGVLGEMGTTAAQFSLMGMATGAMEQGHPFNHVAPEALEAESNVAMIEKLAKYKEGSATNKRSPAAFNEALTHLIGNAEWHIPKADFDQVAQEAGMQGHEMAAKMGATDNYASSEREAGTPITVPMSGLLDTPEEIRKVLARRGAARPDGMSADGSVEAAKMAEKNPVAFMDEIPQASIWERAKQALGISKIPKAPTIKPEQAQGLLEAFKSDDAQTFGPKFTQHFVDAMTESGYKDELKAQAGLGSKDAWTPEAYAKVSSDFKDYLTSGKNDNDTFNAMRDTMAYSYRVLRQNPGESMHGVLDRMIAGKYAGQQVLQKLGRVSWLDPGANKHYAKAIEDVKSSVQAKIIRDEYDRQVQMHGEEYQGRLEDNREWAQNLVSETDDSAAWQIIKQKGDLTQSEANGLAKLAGTARVATKAEAKAAIDQMAKFITDKETPQPDQESLYSKAMEAYHSTDTADLLRLEGDEMMRAHPQVAMKMAARYGQDVDSEYRKGVAGLGVIPRSNEEILANISRDLSERKVGDFRKAAYLKAEQDARAAANKAYSKGDIEGAAVAKGNEIYNHESYRKALDMEKALLQGGDYIRGMRSTAKLNNMSPEYREQMRSLLASMGLMKPEQGKALAPLDKFVSNTLLAHNGDLKLPSLEAVHQQLADGQLNAKDLKIKDFMGLVDTMRALESVGKADKKAFKDAMGMDENEFLLKVAAQPKDATRLLGPLKVKNLNPYFTQMHTDNIVRALEPHEDNGPIKQLFDKWMASDTDSRQKQIAFDKEFNEALAISGAPRKGTYELPDKLGALSPDGKLSTNKFMYLLGLRGDDQAFSKFCKGNKMDPEAMKDWLDKTATKEQWKLASRVADTLQKVGDNHQKMLRSNMLPEMEMVKRVPFKTGAAGDMPGWYWPTEADRTLTPPKDTRGGPYGDTYNSWLSTKSGHEQTRNPGASKLEHLDFTDVSRVAKEVLHDTSTRMSVLGMEKMLKNPTFVDHVKSTIGDGFIDYLRDKNKQVANQMSDSQVFNRTFDKFSRMGRMNYMASVAAARLSILAAHASGSATQVAAELGPKWATAGLKGCRDTKFMQENSAEMSDRLSGDVDADARNAIDDMRNDLDQMGKPTDALAKVAQAGKRARLVAFKTYSAVINAGSRVAFMGGYAKATAAVSEGGLGMDHAEAIKYAERVTRDTMGQSGKAAMDVLHGTNSEFVKLSTMFTSYWSHVSNQMMRHSMTLSDPENWENNKAKVFHAGIGMLAYTVAPVVIHHYTEGAGSGPKDSDTLEKMMYGAADALADSNIFGHIGERAALHFTDNRWDPGWSTAGDVTESFHKTAMAGKDLYDIMAGNREFEGADDKLWRDAAGGPAAMLGVPGAQQMRLTAKYIQHLRDAQWQDTWYHYPWGLVSGKLENEE